MPSLRNGTYLREPDGATLLWFSPYSFMDALANFRKRHLYDDGWIIVRNGAEEDELWKRLNGSLQPGEYVHVRGGKIQ